MLAIRTTQQAVETQRVLKAVERSLRRPGQVRMGDIGEPVKHIELEPMPESEPIKEPTPAPAPMPEREPEKVPA